jgi:hypothetical protein
MRVSIWSPLPPSPSGIADYVAESLPALARHLDLQLVTDAPEAVSPGLRERFPVFPPAEAPAADLDLYHLGNSPSHAWVYRAACARPGVAVLHDWSLHHLVLGETVERGDIAGYLREMRRSHGETGTFVGRQVARALGGELLPALFPLNDRILEGSLAVVGLTEYVRARAVSRLPGRSVLHLRHHLSLPRSGRRLPSSRARPCGCPGRPDRHRPRPATRPSGSTSPCARWRGWRGSTRLRLVVAEASTRHAAHGRRAEGDLTGSFSRDASASSDFEAHLCAAVVLSLRFPHPRRISGALVRALGISGGGGHRGHPGGGGFRRCRRSIDPGPREEEGSRPCSAACSATARAARDMGRPRGACARTPRAGETATSPTSFGRWRRAGTPAGGDPRRAGGRGRPPRLPARGGALGRARPGPGPPSPGAGRTGRRAGSEGGEMTEPALSVVLPAYNEAARLPRTLERIAAHLGPRARRTR